MDAEHPTTCFELLRQGRVVIAGLESEVARLQVQVRDLNDNLKLKQQDGGHRTTRREELLRRQKPAKAEPQAPHTSSAAAPAPRRGDTQSLQRDFDCLHLAAEAEAHEGNLPAAGALFQATAMSSRASNKTVEAGTSTEHAFQKSKSSTESNMVAIFGTPPHFSPLAAQSRTSYVDQARAPQSRTTSQRTDANGAAPAGASRSLGRTDASGAAPAGATQTFREMMVKRMMTTPDAPPTPMDFRAFKSFARVQARPVRTFTTAPVDGGEVLAHRYKAVWGIATGSCQATGDDEDTKDTGSDADGSSPRRSPVRAGGQTTVEHKGRRQVVPIWE